ncbi:MAG: sec-independent translocation protein [Pseudonocardiales bacterium]|nr:sec-independent translocation protein [Pseudonocardiales bacterium]
MGLERPTAWIVLAVVALALFGYKRLPDASRSIGRSLRIFKSEMKGMNTDDEEREAAARAAADNGTVATSVDLPTRSSEPAPAAPVSPAAPATPRAD